MTAPAPESLSSPVPVLVAGAGPVGSTLALALARAGVAVTLLDAGGSGGDPRPATGELRPIALSAASARILATLGVWPALEGRACPIRMVHVSERGRLGMVRLRAQEQGVPALGHVIDAASIAAALAPALEACPDIEHLAPAQLRDAQVHGGHVTVSFQGDGWQQRDARLLVAADGGQSLLRDVLGVAARHHDYGQWAVVCNVTPGRPHEQVAYERFTATGPVALLPLVDGRCGLVWTLPEERAREVAALDEPAFLAALQASFGHRLGCLEAATSRATFPLSLIRSAALTAARTAFIGNAANQLHPVAGQGLNLGLRDAATLAELVADAVRRGADPGAPGLLRRYARSRLPDQRAVVRFTDALARGFTAGPPLLGALRSAGMLLVDLLPPAGDALARRAMGLAAPQPRLVRGLLP